MKYLLFFIAAALIMVLCAWHILITEPLLNSFLSKLLYAKECSFEMRGFKRGIPFRICAETVTLKGKKFATELTFRDVDVRLHPFLLSLAFKSEVFGGRLEGRFKAFNGLSAEIKDADIEPLCRALGFQGQGLLSGKAIDNKFQFRIKDAAFGDVVLANNYIPLSAFSEVKGALELRGDVIWINPISLKGKDGYARINGKIAEQGFDGVIKFMPN